MALVRCVTEMGMGVDVHGLDYTAAAKRAVFDAIHHSSLGFPRLVGKTADDMRVDVTIGVPKPEAVDRQAVLETLPHGGGHVDDGPERHETQWTKGTGGREHEPGGMVRRRIWVGTAHSVNGGGPCTMNPGCRTRSGIWPLWPSGGPG